MTPKFVVATDALGKWRDDLVSGRPPVMFKVANTEPLAGLEIGPGMVTLIGGPPGAGKTAFTMQLVVDALRLTPTLNALVANVEMAPAALLDRQLARLSGIGLGIIRHRKLDPTHKERLEVGLVAVDGIATRLAFARPPWSMENVGWSADAFGADLVVLDYVQRFTASGYRPDRKSAVDGVMETVRRFADAGAAVIVVAAVGRQRDGQGKAGYANLNLASFRESSELEYGADDAYILCREDATDPTAAILKHVKSRHGEPQDLSLRFTASVQRFDAIAEVLEYERLASAVQDVWGQTSSPAQVDGSEW